MDNALRGMHAEADTLVRDGFEVVADRPSRATSIARRGWSYERVVIALIAASILVRLLVAAAMPLASDELLYWRYSKHLAPGFLDHPAMNPFLIRVGTTLFGDTAFGIRVMAVLLGGPASWAVWRAAATVFSSERIGADAALFFNLTLVMSVGSLLATSDASVVATSALLLYCLARLNQSGHGAWWLAIGVAFGVGMFAKYTTLFFAVGMLAWVMLIPRQRQWLATPWPYLGALTAMLVFLPVLIWNADHHWASFQYQTSRMVIRQFTLRYLFELIGSQIGLITPPILALAGIGAFWGCRKGAEREAVTLLVAFIAPVWAYFAWHSLHERVQGNWPECVVPAIACLAALAVHLTPAHNTAAAQWTRWFARATAPVGVAISLLVYAQAIFGIMSLGAHDPTARLLGGGWATTGSEIDRLRANAEAGAFLTTDYTLASELAYYAPSHTPALQVSERVRWSNEPAPSAALLAAPMIYVCKAHCAYAHQLGRRFAQVQFLASVPRIRNGIVIDRFELYRVAQPKRAVLDPIYPILTKASDEYSL